MRKLTLLAQVVTIQLICFVTPLVAQSLAHEQPRRLIFQSLSKAETAISDPNPLCLVGTSMSLDSRLNSATDLTSTVGVDTLREPSVYKFMSAGVSSRSEELLKNSLVLLSAIYQNSDGASSSDEIALAVRQKIKVDPAAVLEIVKVAITAHPGSACEIVKVAIEETDAETERVVSIVETAILASPESMRLISQCAIASAPDSLAAVQAILAKFDPNAGDSAPSSKSADGAVKGTGEIGSKLQGPNLPNPLDRPYLAILAPLPIMPPAVTNVDP